MKIFNIVKNNVGLLSSDSRIESISNIYNNFNTSKVNKKVVFSSVEWNKFVICEVKKWKRNLKK